MIRTFITARKPAEGEGISPGSAPFVPGRDHGKEGGGISGVAQRRSTPHANVKEPINSSIYIQAVNETRAFFPDTTGWLLAINSRRCLCCLRKRTTEEERLHNIHPVFSQGKSKRAGSLCQPRRQSISAHRKPGSPHAELVRLREAGQGEF